MTDSVLINADTQTIFGAVYSRSGCECNITRFYFISRISVISNQSIEALPINKISFICMYMDRNIYIPIPKKIVQNTRRIKKNFENNNYSIYLDFNCKQNDN